MSLIEQARTLFNEVRTNEVRTDEAPANGAVVEDASTSAAHEPASPVDIAREALCDEALERAREEWAAPPRHR